MKLEKFDDIKKMLESIRVHCKENEDADIMCADNVGVFPPQIGFICGSHERHWCCEIGCMLKLGSDDYLIRSAFQTSEGKQSLCKALMGK